MDNVIFPADIYTLQLSPEQPIHIEHRPPSAAQEPSKTTICGLTTARNTWKLSLAGRSVPARTMCKDCEAAFIRRHFGKI